MRLRWIGLVLAPPASPDAGGGCAVACWPFFSYQGSLALGAETVLGSKYFCPVNRLYFGAVCFFMSTAFYWLGFIVRGTGAQMELLGSRLAWVAVLMALVGTMVRWYESYLIGPDVGPHPGEQSARSVHPVLLDDRAVLSVLRNHLQNPCAGCFCHAGGQRGRGLCSGTP